MDADAYALQLAATLTAEQQPIFMAMYHARAKHFNVAVALTIFVGLLGLHKIYLGRYLQATIHLILAIASFLTIGVIWLIIDLINLRRTVDRVNREIADRAYQNVREHFLF